MFERWSFTMKGSRRASKAQRVAAAIVGPAPVQPTHTTLGVEETRTMSNMMSDTLHAAKSGMSSIKEGVKEGAAHSLDAAKHGATAAKASTMHTAVNVLSMIVKGVSATAGIVTVLKKLDGDSGLAWFGLARRRSPLVSVAIFGSGAVVGAAVGAGVALLFAPASGADLRQRLLGRSKLEIVARKIEGKVEDAAGAVATAVKGAMDDAKRAEGPHNGKPQANST